MRETVSTLERGAGPAGDPVAGSIHTPVTVPAVGTVAHAAVTHPAGHGVGIAPAADGCSRRHRMAMRRSPISIDGGSPGSKTRAVGEFSLAFVRIGESRLGQCSRAGQGGCRNNERAKNFQIYHGLLLALDRGAQCQVWLLHAGESSAPSNAGALT